MLLNSKDYICKRWLNNVQSRYKISAIFYHTIISVIKSSGCLLIDIENFRWNRLFCPYLDSFSDLLKIHTLSYKLGKSEITFNSTPRKYIIVTATSPA